MAQVPWTGDLGRQARASSVRESWKRCREPREARPPIHLPHRIHLMAGRVPQGADRIAVKAEMEIVFLENLRHAAGVLAEVRKVETHMYLHVFVGVRRRGCTVGTAREAASLGQRDR